MPSSLATSRMVSPSANRIRARASFSSSIARIVQKALPSRVSSRLEWGNLVAEDPAGLFEMNLEPSALCRVVIIGTYQAEDGVENVLAPASPPLGTPLAGVVDEQYRYLTTPKFEEPSLHHSQLSDSFSLPIRQRVEMLSMTSRSHPSPIHCSTAARPSAVARFGIPSGCKSGVMIRR
jgi:hypothetical protein